MAKDKIADYDASAAGNTDIGGIGIQGTNLPSNFDNAFREIMSQLKEADNGTSPLTDTWSFCDPADRTKIFRLDAGSITTATTRVYTMPNASGTIPLTGLAQTWSDTQTFSGVAEVFSLRSTGVGTGQAFLRFRDSAGTAIGYMGLGSASDDRFGIARNTVGNVEINANATGTITLTGVATFGQAVTITGAATLSSTLGVTGAVTLSSTLAVTGTTTLGTANVTTANVTTFNSGTYSASGASTGTQLDQDGLRSSKNVTSAATHIRFVNPNGTVGSITTNGTATAYNVASDETLKDFIGAYDPQKAVEIIRRDPVRDFHWKRSGEYAVGWGAQTSYSVSQDLATPGTGDPEDEDFMPWGVDQSKRTPYLWAALSWALDEIDQLKSRVAALEASK